MAVKVDDPRDVQDAYDKRFGDMSQVEYDDEFKRIADAERASDSSYSDAGIDQAEAFANDPANSIRAQEQSGAGADANWTTNRDASANNRATQSTSATVKNLVKKGGPFGLIFGLLAGGAGFFGFFGGPALLIVNLAEVVVKRFDYQVTTLEARHAVSIKTKLSGATSGCSRLSFSCKFSTFSDKEIANMEKSGIKANSEKTTLTGRNKVTSLEYNGKTITAKDFDGALKSNPDFANAMHGAYNMRFLSKFDSIWGMIEKRFKISKKAPFEKNATDEERAKTIKEDTKNGRSSTEISATCSDPSKCTDEQKKQAADSAKAKGAADSIADTADSDTNKASQVLDEIKSGGSIGSTLANSLRIDGLVADGCTTIGLMNTFSGVMKTIRKAQFIRYAYIYLTLASMIKAGTATPNDVSFAGNELSNVVKDSSGNLSKSATESFGYRFAAFGDTGMDTRASLAVAGSSYGGDLEKAAAAIYAVVPRNAVKSTCKFVANPIVQVGSLAAGIGGLFFGVTETKVVVQAALKGAFFAGVNLLMPFLVAELGEVLAGELKMPYAEDKGNVITSAVDGMLGDGAGYGGNSVLHKDQAVAFLKLNDEVAASYANYDRSTHSPFDITNSNTFMGSLFTQFAPYLYSSNSPMAVMGNFASILTNTAKNFVSPNAAADSSWLNSCQDPQYVSEDEGGYDIATTPFCNPIRGIPPQYLGATQPEVQQYLQGKGLVDEDGKPTTTGTVDGTSMSYPDFIKECMQREEPFGLEDPSVDKTQECFIDGQGKAYAYMHAIDNRLADISDGTITSAAGTAMNTGSLGGFYAVGATGN